MLTLLERLKRFEMTGVKVDLSGELDQLRSDAERANIPIEFSARGRLRSSKPNRTEKTVWIFDDEDFSKQSGINEKTLVPEIAEKARAFSENTAWNFDDDDQNGLNAVKDPSLFLGSIFEHTQEVIEVTAGAIAGKPLSRDQAVEFLLEIGVMNPEMVRLNDKFRAIRNKAIHSDNIRLTSAEAAEWFAVAKGLQVSVKQRAKESRNSRRG
ncbi:MAG: hypothetical protein OXD48_11080 [Litoreibacter sp.]|nr:hypothetical protein [Litoreibacter sp.]